MDNTKSTLEEFNKIAEEAKEDENLKKLFEDNEDLEFILSTMSTEEKKKITQSGHTVDEIKNLLNLFMNMFEEIKEQVPDYEKQHTMIVDMLHSVSKRARDKMFIEIQKEIKKNPGITLEEYYDQVYPDYKLKIVDKFSESRYNDKDKRGLQIGAKIVVAVLYMLNKK